jgi:RND family efflux transporter MFP subunit
LLVLIYNTEPTAERSSAVRRSAILVDVVAAEQGTYRPILSAVGSVRPEKEIELSTRVGGEIVSLAPGFVPGGFVDQGDPLLRIDAADYETALIARTSELHQAQAEMELELGRQELARSDYEELKGTISSEYETLVLRRPQLNAARARLEAAQAGVKRAELDLQRTRIRAPFAAQVLDRAVNVGSQVAPGEPLGRLVGTENYWVEVAVPAADVRWIRLPGADGGGSPVRVRNRTAWPENQHRSGAVESLIGSLDERTRLARVLVSVSDPLALHPESAGLPPLMVGSFVEVRIEGKVLQDVVRLPRSLLRKNDTVWVMGDDDRLDIRSVRVALRDTDFAYVLEGLAAGERVVVTSLSTVTNGAELRLSESQPPQ